MGAVSVAGGCAKLNQLVAEGAVEIEQVANQWTRGGTSCTSCSASDDVSNAPQSTLETADRLALINTAGNHERHRAKVVLGTFS